MTEKEFENLKIGDKVWVITDWFGDVGEGMKAVEKEVLGKDEKKLLAQVVGGSLVHDHCYLTKSEAWEEEVKRCEEAVKAEEHFLGSKRKLLDRYKAELAKAKEEEEKERKVWTVDFEEGSVICSTKRRWEGSAENYEWSLGSPRYKPCDTKQEAYEALAEFYEKKAKEAWIKSGVKYYGGYKSVALLTKIKPCSKYPGNVTAKSLWQKSCYCGHSSAEPYCVDGSGWAVGEESLFDTEEEAYAEMEKRTPNHVRGKDEFAEKMRRKNNG